MHRVILDCDPGHDDALALLLAIGHPDLDLALVTCVAGNQDVDKTWLSARRIAALAGSAVPVVAGSRQPLKRSLITAATIHGVSGLDGPHLDGLEGSPDSRDAISVMQELLAESAVPITIVATGPLTNIARLIQAGQGLHNVEKIVFMGGSVDRGNWAPYSEFNILVDPEAAEIVVNAGLPVVMIGLNVTHQAIATPDVVQRFRSIPDPVGRVCAEWMTFFELTYRQVFGFPHPPLHDVVAVAATIRHEVCDFVRFRVDIEVEGRFTTGATVVDMHNRSKGVPNVDVALGLDSDLLWDVMFEGISRVPSVR